MYTYESLYKTIKQGRSKIDRTIANNTIARIENDCIVIRYHSSDIATFENNGDISLFTDGYKTFTTKERLNWFIPQPYKIYQERGVWYIWDYQTKETYIYQDGVKFILDNGKYTVINAGNKAEEKRIKDLRKRIIKYSDRFTTALINGKVPQPDNGDCWYCLMRDDSNTPLGELTEDIDHLESHLAEGYYVPSLFVRAIEVFPVSQYSLYCLQSLWMDNKSLNEFETRLFKDQSKSSLQKYLLRQFRIG